jgi:predicted Holliday junction resolvase-like endonuclease
MKEWFFEHLILTFIIIFLILLQIENYITYLNNRLKIKQLVLENKKEENKNKHTIYGKDGKINHNI